MARINKKHIGFKIKRVIAITAMALTGYMVSSAAYAQGAFAPEPCDPQYYESLESRAWLEAQREITQNQNLIFKGDSVLEYTCFDSYLSELADHASDMFSETNQWGSPPGDMATSLSNLVGSALSAYQTSNYNHSLLGGRSSLTSSLNGSISGGSYTCDRMNAVWEAAKCMDFIHNAANDGFFTFAEYASGDDKRFLPTACSPKTADFTGELQTALVNANTPWEEDSVVTYFDLIYPGGTSCAPSSASGGLTTMISTGLQVIKSSGTPATYTEHVCVVPGCYYDPGGNRCCPMSGC